MGEMCRGHLWGYSADLAFITEAGAGRGDAGGLRREGIKSSPRKRRECMEEGNNCGSVLRTVLGVVLDLKWIMCFSPAKISCTSAGLGETVRCN